MLLDQSVGRGNQLIGNGQDEQHYRASNGRLPDLGMKQKDDADVERDPGGVRRPMTISEHTDKNTGPRLERRRDHFARARLCASFCPSAISAQAGDCYARAIT